MDKRSFAQEIYSIVADIPVGRAMHHAPAELHLPCHRVVNSQGRLAPGWGEQHELLANEGVLF